MSETKESDVIVIARSVGDAALADRLAALLADIPGLRLAAPGERADVSVSRSEAMGDTNDFELALSHRESPRC